MSKPFYIIRYQCHILLNVSYWVNMEIKLGRIDFLFRMINGDLEIQPEGLLPTSSMCML